MFEQISNALSDYIHIKVATEEDNDRIVKFLRSIPMELEDFHLSYDRSPNYFALNELQGNSALTFLLLNKDMSIGGVGGLFVRSCWVKGEEKRVAYLSDLRIAPTLYKKTRLEWHRAYEVLMCALRELEGEDKIDYFYTAILKENKPALKSLTNPKYQVVYEELCDYESINIFGPALRKQHDQNHLIFDKAKLADKAQLRAFLEQQNKQKFLGQFFNQGCKHDEWDHREKYWPNFKAQNFLILKKEGKIVGTCLPWATKNSRRFIVQKLCPRFKLLNLILKIFGHRPLVIDDEFSILYLTHLEMSNELNIHEKEAFLIEILNKLKNDNVFKNYHLVSLFAQSGHCLSEIFKRRKLFHIKVPGTLYRVDHRSHLKPFELNAPISIELAVS